MLNWLTRYASVMAELEFDSEGGLLESVLDVGCGPHGLACAAPNARFAGVDVLFGAPVAPGMSALRSDPGPLPFADGSFDTVVCLDTLEHLPSGDRGPFVRELARVAARRVLVACPSEDSVEMQDIIRVEYAARGLPLPGWLNEHDEHGLPSAAQIHEVCSTVPGFTATEMRMANGLLAMLIVLADVLPEFGARAASEFREHGRDWLEVFASARFGASSRRGYVIERETRRRARVSADDVRGSVRRALRCGSCGSEGLLAIADGAQCPACAHVFGYESSGALSLSAGAGARGRTIAPVRRDRSTRLLLAPDWERPATWLPVLARYVADAAADGDHALCIDAVDVRLGLETIQELVMHVCEALSGGGRFADVLLLDTPYARDDLVEVTSVSELAEQIELRRRERPVAPEAVAEHARAAKQLCDAARAIVERRLYAVADDPWTSREPLVTVRIPTWKGTRTLVERTLPSVFRSAYRNLEVIVCSDGPDPDARAAVQAIGDPRLSYIELAERPAYPEHPWSLWQCGGSHAANAAQAHGRGTFIAPLDHDDAFTVDHIEALLAAAAEKGADLVYGQAIAEDRDGGWRTLGGEPLSPDHVTHGAAIYSSRLRHVRLDPDCWLLDEKGDWNMYARMASTGAGVAFCPHVVLAHFRELTTLGDRAAIEPVEVLSSRQAIQIADDLRRTGLDWLLDVPLVRAAP